MANNRVEDRMHVENWARPIVGDDLAYVLGAVSAASAVIAKKIRTAGLSNVYGSAGETNVQGEQQQKLDVLANNEMIGTLRESGRVAGIVSEEDDEPIRFEPVKGLDARYVLAFDPLDGSSNIDVNVNVGTIFGVRELAEGQTDLTAAVLRPGSEQVAAGYVVYGPSTIMVIATKTSGVASFVLDEDGEYTLVAEHMRMPEQGPYYSLNSGNAAEWPAGYRDYIGMLRRGDLGGKSYSARYIGSLVADFHRTLLKGGIFLYPPTEKAPNGKLRLQYEGNPLAMIAEAAGGMAVDGKQRVLDIEPTDVHGRTPLIMGSRREVEALLQAVAEAQG